MARFTIVRREEFLHPFLFESIIKDLFLFVVVMNSTTLHNILLVLGICKLNISVIFNSMIKFQANINLLHLLCYFHLYILLLKPQLQMY